MKRIYLVQVVDSYGPNKFLPLAIAYQWLYAKNENWQLCDVLIEKLPIDVYIKTMYSPDMVALSSYIWNWNYNQELAKAIKKLWPDCIIVVGGPQVPKNDQNFFNKYPFFDIAVHGEGELAFKEILKRTDNFDNIPHVQTKTHFPNTASRIKDINQIPSPILEGFYEPIMAKYPKDTMWQVTYETLRGCPYHCAFCDIGDSYWNKITLFDIDRVKKEIEWMGQNQIEYVSVCDSNWGLLERDIEITKHVIDVKKKYGYPRWWDATWAKNNADRNFEIALINKKENANIFKGVTFAMQSFNSQTLQATDRFNLNLETVNYYLKKYKEEKIPTYSELIWPMPGETYNSLKDGIQQLIDLGQDDFLMIHPLVITDNATMGSNQYKTTHGIKTKTVPLDTYYLKESDLSNCIAETTDAVYSTNTANWQDVLRGNLYSWTVITFYYYGWGHYLAKYMKKYNEKETEFFEKLLMWIIDSTDTMMHKEYNITKTHIEQTFFNHQPWGRKVLGETDILWEYKGATSVVFHEHKNILRDELVRFLIEVYNVNDAELVVDLNLVMCKTNSDTYPKIFNTKKSIAKDMLCLEADTILIDHTDQTPLELHTFMHKAYHWNRKLKYWHCDAKVHDKI